MGMATFREVLPFIGSDNRRIAVRDARSTRDSWQISGATIFLLLCLVAPSEERHAV